LQAGARCTAKDASVARHPKTARLDDDAAQAFDRLITRRGVTYTALIQALGELLAEGVDWVPEEAIRRARATDRERGSRRGE
jgi:hypothetical protein